MQRVAPTVPLAVKIMDVVVYKIFFTYQSRAYSHFPQYPVRLSEAVLIESALCQTVHNYLGDCIDELHISVHGGTCAIALTLLRPADGRPTIFAVAKNLEPIFKASLRESLEVCLGDCIDVLHMRTMVGQWALTPRCAKRIVLHTHRWQQRARRRMRGKSRRKERPNSNTARSLFIRLCFLLRH